MSVQRGILGGLVGLSVFQIAEGLQARTIAKRIQTEGVFINLDLPIVGKQRIQLRPPASSASDGSSSETFQLPPDIVALQQRMHRVSLGVALALGIATFFLAGLDNRGEDEEEFDDSDDDVED